jgi:LPXTG-motif cell wall-anchored protein
VAQSDDSRALDRSAIMGYSDTFAVLGGLLLLAAALILFTRKAQASGPGGH